MPAKLGMRLSKLRYLLLLPNGGVCAREIGRLLDVARSTTQVNVKRAAVVGLQWPLPEEATADALEQRLFGRTDLVASKGLRSALGYMSSTTARNGGLLLKQNLSHNQSRAARRQTGSTGVPIVCLLIGYEHGSSSFSILGQSAPNFGYRNRISSRTFALH